ncbi:hypothetical protein RUM43_001993 [Polyplax serrata]|uniref:Spermatogenesis-associated protein 13 n=1 Tax=Polyplax serrata TaxID=468196 RepID=A0AAN8PFD8_POLSC
MASTRGHNLSVLRLTNLSEGSHLPLFQDGPGNVNSQKASSIEINDEPVGNVLMICGLSSSIIVNQKKRDASPVEWCNGDVYLGKSGWAKMQKQQQLKNCVTTPTPGSMAVSMRSTPECIPKKTFRPDYLAIPKKIGHAADRCKSSSPIDRNLGCISPHSLTPIISPPPAFKDADANGEPWRTVFAKPRPSKKQMANSDSWGFHKRESNSNEDTAVLFGCGKGVGDRRRSFGLKSHASDSSLLERDHFGDSTLGLTSPCEPGKGFAQIPRRVDGSRNSNRFSSSSTLTSSADSSSASSSSLSSPSASPQFANRRERCDTRKQTLLNGNSTRVKRSRSLQLSEEKRLNSMERTQWHGGIARARVHQEPRSEPQQYTINGNEPFPGVQSDNINVYYSDLGQLRKQKHELLREAAEEARFVSEFVSGRRSRAAARNLLYHRYLNLSEDDDYSRKIEYSRVPESGVHFVGMKNKKEDSVNLNYDCSSSRQPHGSAFYSSISHVQQQPIVRFTGSSPSILDELPVVEQVKAKPQKFNVMPQSEWNESENNTVDCDRKSQEMKKFGSQFQVSGMPSYVNKNRQTPDGKGERFRKGKNRKTSKENLDKLYSTLEIGGRKFSEKPAARGDYQRQVQVDYSSVTSVNRRNSRKDRMEGEKSLNSSQWAQDSWNFLEDPVSASEFHRRAMSLPKSFRTVRPSAYDYEQISTLLPKKMGGSGKFLENHAFENVNNSSRYRQQLTVVDDLGMKLKHPTNYNYSESGSTGVAEYSPLYSRKDTPKNYQEILPSKVCGHTESVLGKFRKGVLVRLKGKSRNPFDSCEYFGSDIENRNAEVVGRNRTQGNSNSNLKLKFGSLMWKPGKDGKKLKTHAGNGECSSVDSGIQIEFSGNADDCDYQITEQQDNEGGKLNGKEINQTTLRTTERKSYNVDVDGGNSDVNYSYDYKKNFLKNNSKQLESAKNRFRRHRNNFHRIQLKRSFSYPGHLGDTYSPPSSPAKNVEIGTFAYSDGELYYEFTSDDEAVSVSESLIASPTLGREKGNATKEFDKVLIAEALWDHVTIEQDELPFRAGDAIEVLDTCDRDWWWGKSGQKFGYFPSDFVRVRVNQEETSEVNSQSPGVPQEKVSSHSSTLPANDKVRSSVVRELLNTEQHFVAVLNDIVEGYIVECKKRTDLFTGSQIRSIFSNLEDLLTFQSKFLADLEKRVNSNAPHKSLIGEIFLIHRLGFQMYSEYCNSHPMSIASLQELYKSAAYTEFFENCRKRRGLIQIPLDGYLLTPVQRICKYPLQLAELLKHTEADHPDYDTTREALDVMKKVATLINERKRKMESLEKLFTWQCRVDGWEGEDLIALSSQLIHQNDAIRVSSGVWMNNVTLFLFDHQIVYCKKDLLKRNTYVYKGRIYLDCADVIDLPDGKNHLFGSTVKHGIQIYNYMDDKWLVFCCRSHKDKVKWLEALLDERKLVAQDREEGLNLTKSARELAKISAFTKGMPNKPKSESSYPYKRFFKGGKRSEKRGEGQVTP